MTNNNDFEKRYQEGDLPWDTGEPDPLLQEAVESHSIQPCAVLELGSGTGTNALWLAQKGFQVTGIDLSETAVAMAQKKAQGVAGLNFSSVDILKDPLPGGPYDMVFDRGCFHCFVLPHRKVQVVEKIRASLHPEGLWFSIIGSTDGREREVGPPRLSVLEIAGVVEPFFEILEIRATHLQAKLAEAPKAWSCMFRRR